MRAYMYAVGKRQIIGIVHLSTRHLQPVAYALRPMDLFTRHL